MQSMERAFWLREGTTASRAEARAVRKLRRERARVVGGAAGHTQPIDEAKGRLAHREQNGPSPFAFTFKDGREP